MKKILLLMSVALMSTLVNAQVICYVEAPSVNEGNYDFTYAQGATWGVADLTNPANSVTGTMVMVDDGSAADSLGCVPSAASAYAGNVAVLYRGSCEFGLKAKGAQDAGAIACIIINNLGGAPVAMGAGAEGINVTIPTVMITNTAGALLKAEIEAGTSTVFIGSKNGLYGDDLGIRPDEILRAETFGIIQDLAQDASEFSVKVGAWVRNYGTNDQNNVSLNCTITGGSSTYNETSTPITILAGDSVFIPLMDYSEASYMNDYYDMVYTINMTPTDESTFDNMQVSDFMIQDSLHSHSRLESTDGSPISTTNQFTAEDTRTCVYFRDPNASRMAINGMTVSAGTSQNPTPTSLDGEFIEVFAFEWLNNFTDVTDYGDSTIATLQEIGRGDYLYISDQQSEDIFIPFNNQVQLVDDQRYLFCLDVFAGVYPGYDTDVDYTENYINTSNQTGAYAQPVNVIKINNDAQYYFIGYGLDQSLAASINMFDAAQLGIMETPVKEIVAYPNPATEFINVPLSEVYGDVIVTITDMNGKIVSTQNVSMDSNLLTVDVTTIATGMYAFNVIHGEESDVFTVAVTRK